MIQFSCPSCAAVFSVGDEKAGKTGKCPKCDAKFVIPDAEPGAAPSPPPPVADDNVEIKPCPGCQAKLTVARGDIGLDVECPYCKTVYKATKSGGSSAVIRTDRPSKRSAPVEDDEDDRPKRRRRFEDEEDDDRPRKRSRRDDDDDEYYDRPKKRMRRSRRASRSGAVTAVGTLNYILGGLSLCCSCFLFLGMGFIEQGFKQRGQGANEDLNTLKTILVVFGVVYIFVGALLIVGGIGVSQRKNYGRYITFATTGLAILLAILSIVSALVNAVAARGQGLGGAACSLLIWGGYGLFGMITMIKHGDEFD